MGNRASQTFTSVLNIQKHTKKVHHKKISTFNNKNIKPHNLYQVDKVCVSDKDECVPEDISLLAFLISKSVKQNIKMLYDSALAGFEGRDLVSSIQYNSHLLFIIESDKDFFGFYQRDTFDPQMNIKSNMRQANAKSEEVLLFSLNKTTNKDIVPLFFKKNCVTKHSFSVYDNYHNLFMNCSGAFWIENNGTVFFNTSLPKCFDVSSSNRNSIYSNNSMKCKLKINRFCVVTCL
ncbi:hypothetical protein EIN_016280 [Entamoeba invadens IP1]|uniref:hypothetical protein n=1 Tax=Entamoeba invadens IP1 TaxID=370355 RepID=UPI0002C3DB98|nr:hypothetical protein EIN_016280 [Entamoeba invadens IP1]ELP90409.1 hypothetical protein EIN_016280 [Entamoeba invadens IP1]|eukprot:XP_004257180.1 hypothetical protein EIN_016280 [Entamoeba invadens IP1]